ncbi:hypothetical protein ACJMK2_037952, partial [Sinanodonta woodiana]
KPNFESEKTNNDNFPTATSLEQACVEDSVGAMYTAFKNRLELDSNFLNEPILERKMHVAFLKKGLTHLSQSYECLDASRPWLCYWILHSLDLLDEPVSDDDISEISQFLANCQCPDGGFGGGPGQVAHLAPTYAAVNALCILGTEEAYKVSFVDECQGVRGVRSLENERVYLLHQYTHAHESCLEKLHLLKLKWRVACPEQPDRFIIRKCRSIRDLIQNMMSLSFIPYAVTK